MRALARILGLVLGGAVLYAALGWFFGRLPLALFESGWPGWLLDITFYSLDWITSFATGIGIGLLARRYSLWIGAAAACIGNLLFRALDRLIFSPGIWPYASINPIGTLHGSAVAALFGAAYALAGEYARSSRPSNKRFERTRSEQRAAQA